MGDGGISELLNSMKINESLIPLHLVENNIVQIALDTGFMEDGAFHSYSDTDHPALELDVIYALQNPEALEG